VSHAREAHGISVRRACSILGADRSAIRYRRRRSEDAATRQRLKELAAERRRFGWRRLKLLLERDPDEPQEAASAVCRGTVAGSPTWWTQAGVGRTGAYAGQFRTIVADPQQLACTAAGNQQRQLTGNTSAR
jgi:hypothetical protein